MLRYKVGFGLLVLLTVLDAAWIAALVSDRPDAPVEPRAGRMPVEPPPEPRGENADSTRDAQRSRPPGVPPRALRAEVVDHVDGDTLRLAPVDASTFLVADSQTTVRLLEIDTPESVDPNSPDQCYAKRADAALQDLAPLGAVVWAAPDQELLDPYDRALLYLWTERGRFINLALVRDGFAKAVLYEPNDEYIAMMRRAEREARRAGKGLWGSCDYIGQTRGLAQLPATPSRQPRAQTRTDPRFDYCYEANDAGYGNYVSGRDPEYGWYDDADADGRVCEF